ncbi:MAG: cobalamin biosynthesis protein CobD [Coprobacter sp.]|nr:cobalamin biosynthesis protein CobD [Coprobacter sp.]
MEWLTAFYLCSLPVIAGWCADRIWGDPLWLPHPIVGFGKAISAGEKRLNQEGHKMIKGGILAVLLIGTVYALTDIIIHAIQPYPVVYIAVVSTGIFFFLAGKTLIDEVREVFYATDRSTEEGRQRVARIVGRDTASLDAQEIRTAALETLSENLSDGVIAPLFWYIVAGLPGMAAYKMINTLDSMIGYRTERYLKFGRTAARIDDAANYIPARLTALLMLTVSGKTGLWSFVKKQARNHLSPNSGWCEAALAGILSCRFGGAHDYFGERIEKPYIGENQREIETKDMEKAIKINRQAEIVMVILTALLAALRQMLILSVWGS